MWYILRLNGCFCYNATVQVLNGTMLSVGHSKSSFSMCIVENIFLKMGKTTFYGTSNGKIRSCSNICQQYFILQIFLYSIMCSVNLIKYDKWVSNDLFDLLKADVYHDTKIHMEIQYGNTYDFHILAHL